MLLVEGGRDANGNKTGGERGEHGGCVRSAYTFVATAFILHIGYDRVQKTIQLLTCWRPR